jgi:GNAT superfamily N-acetyltransferase
VSFAVRAAAPADVDELAALEAQARAALLPNRGGAAWLRDHPPIGDGPRWATLIERDWVWVATIDALVVGYLQLALDDDVARVRQVFVRPEARGLGFGDDLLGAAMEHARLSGCAAIETEALPGDRDTKNLYERAGITARLLVLRRNLDTAEAPGTPNAGTPGTGAGRAD